MSGEPALNLKTTPPAELVIDIRAMAEVMVLEPELAASLRNLTR